MQQIVRFKKIFLMITLLEYCIHGKLTYINTSTNWYKANIRCNSGSLAESQDIQQMTAVLPTDGSLAWINQLGWFSEFVYYQGCYKYEQGTSVILDTLQIYMDNDVVPCMLNCQKSGLSTFSLTADTCHCLKSNLGGIKIENVTTCNTTCSGDPSNFCGGPGVMSVYTIVQRSMDDITVKSKNTECYNALKLRDMMNTYTEDCHEIRQGYFCTKYTAGGKITEAYIMNGSWFDARKACMQHGGVLGRDLGALSQLADGQYWTGLRRYIVKATPSEMLPPVYLCIACQNNKNDTQCVHRKCDENHGFLCKNDMPPPGFPFETSTSGPEPENLKSSNVTTQDMNNSTLQLSSTINSIMNTSELDSTIEDSYFTTSIVSGTYHVNNNTQVPSTSFKATLPSTTSNNKDTSQTRVLTTTIQILLSGNNLRNNNAFGSYLTLGIIAGLLFVLSVASVAIISFRRHRCRHHQLITSNSPKGKIVITQIDRQRSFSNPGFHETNLDVLTSSLETLSIKLSKSSTDLEAGNERKCDDCSTFTLKKRLAEAVNESPTAAIETTSNELNEPSSQGPEGHSENLIVRIETENDTQEMLEDDVFKH